MDHFVKKTMAEVEDITAEIDKKSEVRRSIFNFLLLHFVN